MSNHRPQWIPINRKKYPRVVEVQFLGRTAYVIVEPDSVTILYMQWLLGALISLCDAEEDSCLRPLLYRDENGALRLPQPASTLKDEVFVLLEKVGSPGWHPRMVQRCFITLVEALSSEPEDMRSSGEYALPSAPDSEPPRLFVTG